MITLTRPLMFGRTLGVFALAVLCMLPPVSLAGGLTVGAEYFDWHEFDALDKTILTETGPRYFIALESGVDLGDAWHMVGYAKAYGGLVDYNGKNQLGVPAKTTTSYSGGLAELRSQWVLNNAGYVSRPHWMVEGAVGADWWSRNIYDAPVASGYVEEYTVGYGKLGIRLDAGSRTGLTMALGVKYPFTVKEQVYWGDVVTVRPKGRPSAYLSLGVQFARNWSLHFDYDAYRFDASDKVPVYIDSTGNIYTVNCATCTPGSVYQPKSSVDTYGLGLTLSF